MDAHERTRVGERLTDLWGEMREGEWQEWNKRLSSLKCDFALKALSTIFEEQNARRRPTWRQFMEAYVKAKAKDQLGGTMTQRIDERRLRWCLEPLEAKHQEAWRVWIEEGAPNAISVGEHAALTAAKEELDEHRLVKLREIVAHARAMDKGPRIEVVDPVPFPS